MERILAFNLPTGHLGHGKVNWGLASQTDLKWRFHGYDIQANLGINNKLPDFSLHIRTRQVSGDYLRDAVNVDIDNSGRLLHRKVPQLVQAMTGAHSIHMTSATAGYLVRDSVLYSIVLPTYAETPLRVLSSNATAELRRTQRRCLLQQWYRQWADQGRYPLPASFSPTPSAPTVSVIAGSLPLGNYQIAVSYVNSTTGEEGGVSGFRQTTLAQTVVSVSRCLQRQLAQPTSTYI